ncbi:DUF2213 domain-containing protein [Pseudomonas sp. 10C3]|uniref:DUF2213 domain-containing protein n=1 Tax=Pseudomonas sp. 10C3 TaxID=3118753 RepID=UPI002E819966|nr:DUF2213 domain-containing protein [Pseudomonas sp. 10C3]MEE3504843.1 DUF2213 domain-containing protein [Pseudomonas sp. 10C3]
MRVRTQDEALSARYFVPEQISPRQHFTPEGFLLCEGVPIARTGTLIYGEHEVPVEANFSGLVTIERNAEDVFRPETLASFEGKSVTIDHPEEGVTPQNWRELTVGTVQNVRRGEGVEQDLVIADLLITDHEAITEVRAGLRQVSCGYDADYEQLSPGRGAQRNIVGNHVALVERGRCGSRCAIGDKETEMKKPIKRTFADRLRAAFMSKDAEAAEALAKEVETADGEEEEEESKSTKTGDSKTLDSLVKAVGALTKRFSDMESELKESKTSDEEEDPDMTQDDVLNAEVAASTPEAKGVTYTGDSDAWADLLSRAEILSPGISFPTRDSKVKFADAVCSCQRQALTKSALTEDGKSAVNTFLFGRQIGALTADQVATAFMGASELIKAQNNSQGNRTKIATNDFGLPGDIAAINKRNNEFWNGARR